MITGATKYAQLPSGEYSLLELYCTEKNCDCRRVILSVASQQQIEAMISFGFNADDPMRGPFLDPLNKQGRHANALLSFVTEAVLTDPEYVARLERHYAITKDIIAGRLRPNDAQPSPRLTGLKEVVGSAQKVLNEFVVAPNAGIDDHAPFDIHQSICDESEELNEALINEYAEGLTNRFAASPEAEPLRERDVYLGWPHSFLYYSAAHLGLIPPEMSSSDVDEVLFEIIPRKVAAEADQADEIITVLRAFWQFLQREFQLTNAEQILCLLGSGAMERLHDLLDNSANFGMAKSMFAAGRKAGFDLTTEDGLMDFLVASSSPRLASRDSDLQRPLLSSPRGLSPFAAEPPPQFTNRSERRAAERARLRELKKSKRQSR